jgi:predicted nucleic-acid-binding protein
MVAVDTNIVVRLLTKDDLDQYQKAYQLFDKNDVFIADSVILEAEWVLRFAYRFSYEQIATALTHLFGLSNVYTTQPTLLAQVFTWYSQGFDFADAFHLAHCQSCKAFFTFDKKMIKAAKTIESCKVLLP